MKVILSISLIIILLLSIGCSSSKTPTPSPAPKTTTAAPTIALATKPATSKPATSTVPNPKTIPTLVTPAADYQKQIDDLKKQLDAQVKMNELTNSQLNQVRADYAKISKEFINLQNSVLTVAGQVNVSQGLNIISRDNVNLHLLMMNGGLNTIPGGQTVSCDFGFRVSNNSGKKVVKLTIAGNVTCNQTLWPQNIPYPTIVDVNDKNINYHASWDQQKIVYFEAYSFEIPNQGYMEFRPRLQIQGTNASSLNYAFNMQITGFTFNVQ